MTNQVKDQVNCNYKGVIAVQPNLTQHRFGVQEIRLSRVLVSAFWSQELETCKWFNFYLKTIGHSLMFQIFPFVDLFYKLQWNWFKRTRERKNCFTVDGGGMDFILEIGVLCALSLKDNKNKMFVLSKHNLIVSFSKSTRLSKQSWLELWRG
jgi:hypothetical protein